MTDGGRSPAVARLAQPRRGHFDLGTGFHGDLWLDLDALFLRPALLRPHFLAPSHYRRGQEGDAKQVESRRNNAVPRRKHPCVPVNCGRHR